MASLWEEFKFGKALLAFIKEASPRAAFALSDVALAMKDREPAERVAATAMKDDGFRQLYQGGYRPEPLETDMLRRCARGSLGHGFLEHLERGDYRSDFYPPRDPSTPVGYLALRELQTHDLFHVLTGYTTSLAGEMALQAFMLAQHGSGLSAALVAAGLLRQLRTDPSGVADLMSEISTGFERGKKARFVLGIPWERHLNEPLDTLRTEARIASRVQCA